MSSEVEQLDGQTGLRVLTWNINGLRSLDNFTEWLRRLDADILCFQETKVTRDMLTEPLAIVPGYTSYYAFSRGRQGYSGVATYCRTASTPVAAEEGVTGVHCKGESEIGGTDLLQIEFSQDELKSLDSEGRCVITKHAVKQSNKYVVVLNLYCPRADPERDDRKRFKLMFYKAVDLRANTLKAQGHRVIVVGDINTSHRELDHCDPYEEFHDHPGRRFLSHFLQSDSEDTSLKQKASQGDDDPFDEAQQEDWEVERVEVEENQFLDSFRIFHADREMAFTCWNTKMNCRSTNYGTRIDYIFISKELDEFISNCDIHPDIEGSDHCPVSARFNFCIEPSSKPPPAATKYFPEFQGKQLSIKDLFAKKSAKRDRSPEVYQPKVTAKKAKPVNSKITSFFAPKLPTPAAPSVQIHVTKEDDDLISEAAFETVVTKNVEVKAAWGKLFKPPPPAPLCPKHKEPAVKRKVTKKGPNQGLDFYVCGRGEGRSDDPNARCDFFKWAKPK